MSLLSCENKAYSAPPQATSRFLLTPNNVPSSNSSYVYANPPTLFKTFEKQLIQLKSHSYHQTDKKKQAQSAFNQFFPCVAYFRCFLLELSNIRKLELNFHSILNILKRRIKAIQETKIKTKLNSQSHWLHLVWDLTASLWRNWEQSSRVLKFSLMTNLPKISIFLTLLQFAALCPTLWINTTLSMGFNL